MKKIAQALIILAMFMSIFAFPSVYATDACDIAGENNPLICGTPDSDEETALMDTVKSVLNTVYLWIGIIAVVVIVIGGIRYMTSAGEAEKIKRAKATIMYSVIGLVVTLAAFAITNFIIGALDGRTPGETVADTSPDDDSSFSSDRKKIKKIITINHTTLAIGQQIAIKARVIPDYAEDKNLKYSSSNSSVATVDDKGIVKAIKPGNATITISSSDGRIKSDVTVTVASPIEVKSIQLSETSIALKKGQTKTIKATVKPDNAADKTLSWESSNPKVATVTQSGTIKAINDGIATIAVSAKNAHSNTTITTKATVKVTSEIATTTGSQANKKYKMLLDFRKETRKIVDKHDSEFYYHNYTDRIKKLGGYKKYVKNLGGVFTDLADTKKIPIKTAADIQLAAEYVWGLWSIWGTDYGSGGGGYHSSWGLGNAKDGFYYGEPNRSSQLSYAGGGKSINSILKTSTNIRTNCNATVNTFVASTNLVLGTGSSNAEGLAKKSKVGKIKYIDELKVGDLVHYFNSSGEWHHVTVVGEVYKDYVVMYDGGSRWVESRKFKKITKRTHSTHMTNDYAGETWFGVRIWNIDQNVTLKGLND